MLRAKRDAPCIFADAREKRPNNLACAADDKHRPRDSLSEKSLVQFLKTVSCATDSARAGNLSPVPAKHELLDVIRDQLTE